jgi:hypothetical protein
VVHLKGLLPGALPGGSPRSSFREKDPVRLLGASRGLFLPEPSLQGPHRRGSNIRRTSGASPVSSPRTVPPGNSSSEESPVRAPASNREEHHLSYLVCPCRSKAPEERSPQVRGRDRDGLGQGPMSMYTLRPPPVKGTAGTPSCKDTLAAPEAGEGGESHAPRDPVDRERHEGQDRRETSWPVRRENL